MSGTFDGLPPQRRIGLEKMEQVYGFDMTDGTGDFFAYTADHLFADIWTRPGLSDRDRRLLLIGLLAGSAAVTSAFRRPLRRGRLAAGAAVTALALVPVVAAGVGWGLVGVGNRLTPARANLPAVAVEQANGPLGSRLLLLRPSATVVDFELLGTEPGELLRDLIYAFSHDLRTPLLANAMNMNAALRGAYGELPPAYRATLENGLQANETLLALADQLLSVAKFESGEEGGGELEEVRLRELVLSVLADLRPRAEAKGLTVETHLLGVSVMGRKHDLRRAVQNLLDNAVKFSPPGGTVVLTLSDDGDEAALSVLDSGPGIPAERQGRLFQRFRGAGAGSGSGLGLYLTRRIAEAHGGQVRYSRTARAQSQFTLTLPEVHRG